MGTFQGHLLPGVSFMTLGFLWTFNIMKRVIMCKDHNKPFFNTVTYPLPMHGRCVKWPLEAGIKIILSTLAMGAELFAATNYGQAGKVVYMGDLQHMTMYGFFCFSGVIDILLVYDKIPPGTDHIALTMAFVVEALLFSHHLTGGDELSVRLHTLLIYAIAACAVMTAMELQIQNSLVLALVRAFTVTLQGTWFINIGFILYPPVSSGLKHWESNERSLMVATIFFTWHFFAVFALLALVGTFSYCMHTRVCRPTHEDYFYEMSESETSDEEDVDLVEGNAEEDSI